MSSTKKEGVSAQTTRQKQEALILALKAFDSNLGGALGDETRWTRFFKVMRRDDGSWLAMLGTLHEGDEAIIYFGNGRTLMKSITSLGKSMAANEWREDRFT